MHRKRILAAACLAVAGIAGAAQAAKPVVAPGSKPPPAPPPVVTTPAPEAPKVVAPPGAAPAPKKAAPAPAEFYAAPAPVAGEPARPAAEDPDPAELRFRKRAGDYAFVMTLHPGKPRPGQPVEVIFNVNEMLPLPDPDLGDRKPVNDIPLFVTISGPESGSYLLHRVEDAGDWGFHFFPHKPGLYTVAVDRVDGLKGLHAEYGLGVGVPTPVPVDTTSGEEKSGQHNAKKPLFKPTFELDQASRRGTRLDVAAPIEGTMHELGVRWMELDRTAGTPAAAAALKAVEAEAQKTVGQVPPRYQKDNLPFDQYAEEMVKALTALESVSGDAGKLHSGMERVQDHQCLKCHAQFRLDFAAEVWRWPDFQPVKKTTKGRYP